MKKRIDNMQSTIEEWNARDVIGWALAEFGQDVAVASSFGAEDVVLIDLATRADPDVRVFTLDTDFLFPETYRLIEQIERRYGVRVERCKSAHSPNRQARNFGEALWSRDPSLCCRLRKVAPLKTALNSLRAWITGIRRDQTPTRAHARKLEWDQQFGLVKVNPLADWASKQIWQYIQNHDVPYNPLHDRGYPSIGCTYCTRPVRADQDSRAGRWAGFSKTECGLHSLDD